MGFDKSALGVLSPLVAVMGDIVCRARADLLRHRPASSLQRAGRRAASSASHGQRVLDAPGANRACGVAVARRPVVARIADAIRHSPAVRPLLAAVGVRARSPDRAAADGGDRRVGPDLGHELVFRHGELGGRDLELVGRVAHRRLARGDGRRRRRLRRHDARRPRLHRDQTGRTSPAAEPFSFIVIGDTGRRRRQPAGAEGLAASRRGRRRCAIRGGVVGRRVSDGRDEGLRVATSGFRSRA